MMDAAKKHRFQAIIVYRLDRISRNISDFAGLIEELSRLDIAFISIKEQFDTGTSDWTGYDVYCICFFSVGA